MAAPAEDRRSARKHIRRHTPATVAQGSSVALPPEVLQTAVRRLGFLGLIVAVMFPAAWWVEHLAQPSRLEGPVPLSVAAATFVIGVAMCILAWSGRVRAELAVNIGLIFEVIVAFAISLSENTPAWPEDQLLRGVSWNCLWISMYVVAVPSGAGKTVLAAIAAACMAPFGMLVAAAIENATPPPNQVLNQLLPFVAAGWAIPVARHFHHLGTQVTRARALGSYELLQLIGKGGMGEVWTARHRLLTRISAIKLIRPESLTAAGTENAQMLVRRFEREARATAALRSPHTVALYDYGVAEDGSFYYVMELLDGLDLNTLVRRYGPQPAGRVVHFLTHAAKSLAEAHEAGLVHRDIKPHNIFACRLGADFDFAKVLDFGLVKLRRLEPSEALTREGMTTGTPAFMAPELAMGQTDIDGRADLYALGCVAYWLLTGELVFDAPSAVAMAIAHLREDPVPPSTRTEIEVPPALDRLILRCLAKDPAERPATARQLLDLLADCPADPWTAQDAETWWRTHVPQTLAPPVSETLPTDHETLEA